MFSVLTALACLFDGEAFGRKQGLSATLQDGNTISEPTRPKVLMVQSDNRIPEKILSGGRRRGKIVPHRADVSEGALVEQYWSLSLELNLRYCCSQQYDLTYYHLVDTFPIKGQTSVTGSVTNVASCVQAGVGPREPSYCKLPAVADALSLDYDFVVFIDSDAYLNDFNATIPSLLAKAQNIDAGADDSQIGLYFAYNWPWNEDKPNGGFFIFKQTTPELRAINRDILTHWWHHDEIAHNGIFEQHSIWALLDGTAPW